MLSVARDDGDRPTVIVAGALAQRPGIGGHAWVFLNWLFGLRSIGADVVFVDRLEPHMMADPGIEVLDSPQWQWLRRVMTQARLNDRFALRWDHGRRTHGMDEPTLRRAVRNAVVVLDFMGYLGDDDVLAGRPKVFVDIDPGFAQLWRTLGQHDAFAGYDAVATVGLDAERPGCIVADTGIPTVATLPPVALARWPLAGPARGGTPRITTIATWRGPFAPIDYCGDRYGLRVHEFRRFFGLPELVPHATLELALHIDAADEADATALRVHGWKLTEPRSVASCTGSYRRFINQSTAELCVAKELYVRTSGGWFSDRSACYLAAGRPVLAQDTGFTRHLPTGEGLLSFTDPVSAADAIRAIVADPHRHARAARRIAVDYFDARHVIRGLFDRLGIQWP